MYAIALFKPCGHQNGLSGDILVTSKRLKKLNKKRNISKMAF